MKKCVIISIMRLRKTFFAYNKITKIIFGEIPKRPKVRQVGTSPDKKPLASSPGGYVPLLRDTPLALEHDNLIIKIYIRRNTQEAEGAPLLRE